MNRHKLRVLKLRISELDKILSV